MSEVDTCTSYPLLLAAEDVVPIILAGIGYVYLTRRVRQTVPEAAPAVGAAAVLLVAGSFVAGPLRKVLVTLADGEACYPLLQTPFFSALAPGFAILTWGAVSVLKGRKVSFWPYAGLLALGVMGAVAADDRIILLASGGLWAVAAAVAAALIARRQQDRPTMGLYALYAVGTLALPGIGARDNVSDVTNQWIAQGVNTVTQGIYAYASYRLLASYRRWRDRSSPSLETAT